VNGDSPLDNLFSKIYRQKIKNFTRLSVRGEYVNVYDKQFYELDGIYDGVLNLCVNKQQSYIFTPEFSVAGSGPLSSTFASSVVNFPPIKKVCNYLREPVGQETDSIYDIYQCFLEHNVTTTIFYE